MQGRDDVVFTLGTYVRKRGLSPLERKIVPRGESCFGVYAKTAPRVRISLNSSEKSKEKKVSLQKLIFWAQLTKNSGAQKSPSVSAMEEFFSGNTGRVRQTCSAGEVVAADSTDNCCLRRGAVDGGSRRAPRFHCINPDHVRIAAPSKHRLAENKSRGAGVGAPRRGADYGDGSSTACKDTIMRRRLALQRSAERRSAEEEYFEDEIVQNISRSALGVLSAAGNKEERPELSLLRNCRSERDDFDDVSAMVAAAESRTAIFQLRANPDDPSNPFVDSIMFQVETARDTGLDNVRLWAEEEAVDDE